MKKFEPLVKLISLSVLSIFSLTNTAYSKQCPLPSDILNPNVCAINDANVVTCGNFQGTASADFDIHSAIVTLPPHPREGYCQYTLIKNGDASDRGYLILDSHG